ncbi:MAG TPA: heme-copper oxidase subunit III, partial [Aigarchaeota archaeon]|nr:heme-copper oxidase subunit III [Aigarchaeota archaeon]
LGAILFLPVAVAGLLLLVASVVGLAKEGLAEKFKIPEAPEGARWPFTQVEKVKLGVWMFLYSEAVLFGSLIGSYVFVRLNSAAWPAPGEVLSITNGAVNTFILLTSSLTAVLALASVRVGNQTGLKAGLLATFILGLAFLLNKAVEWNEIFQHGFTFSSGLPAAAFYITTGAHGAHVAAGLVVLAYIIAKAFKGGYTRENHSTVEYFGLYWHFVDIVWVFLFPLFYLI